MWYVCTIVNVIDFSSHPDHISKYHRLCGRSMEKYNIVHYTNLMKAIPIIPGGIQ